MNKTLSLSKGGVMLQNDVLANLHKGEAVLRAPIAASLEEGIRSLSNQSSGGTSLTLHIENFSGTEDNIDSLAKKVGQVLERTENRKGTTRRYGVNG